MIPKTWASAVQNEFKNYMIFTWIADINSGSLKSCENILSMPGMLPLPGMSKSGFSVSYSRKNKKIESYDKQAHLTNNYGRAVHR